LRPVKKWRLANGNPSSKALGQDVGVDALGALSSATRTPPLRQRSKKVPVDLPCN
jgi:hypothetical protein